MNGFAHAMPYGATLTPEGRVQFRFWAPAAGSVSLMLTDPDRTLPMRAVGEGWFELVTAAPEEGSRYAFQLPDGTRVPDPAARAQEKGPEGYSIVVDPRRYAWANAPWKGKPWHEAVLYELHVGAFTPEGTFAAARARLPYLAELGITAVELMPLASFPGTRNWGYDGVLPYAPDASYGPVDDLKALIDDAHGLGMMVFLDVVYNHFGPEGNYLTHYAPDFFTDRHKTPWGSAIDFEQGPVRDFFIHNALYWLEEFRFDGLRLDAVHAIYDDSKPGILEALARTVRRIFRDRHIHLVLENDDNCAWLLARDEAGVPVLYTAQWNDDFHHAAHTILTGESAGYYSDYASDSPQKLARGLAEGFIYQGDPSPFRDGAPHGEPTTGLPPDAFVAFLQNHDQIGNRAFGERLSTLVDEEALGALQAIQLLSPGIPLLFMGEEWLAKTPFQFFCDFEGALADAVRKGRRAEFARFPEFSDERRRAEIPDAIAAETFMDSKLSWPDMGDEALETTRRLLALRRTFIVPLLASRFLKAKAEATPQQSLYAEWHFAGGSLHLRANLSGVPVEAMAAGPGPLIFTTHKNAESSVPPWYVSFSHVAAHP